MDNCRKEIVKRAHHEQKEFCSTRAKYRQGRKLTAVKVYTVSDESPHLLVTGVPALGLLDDLKRVCSRFGDVKSLAIIPGYSEEDFVDTYHMQYSQVQSARHAKRRLDGMSFYGGVLHVCYAPEIETVDETRTKLVQRRKDVACRISGRICHSTSLARINPLKCLRKGERSVPKFKLKRLCSNASYKCIWKGLPTMIDPRVATKSGKAPEYGPFLPEVVKSGVASINTALPVQSNINFQWSTLSKFIPRPIAVKKEIMFNKSSDIETDHISNEHSRMKTKIVDDNASTATHVYIQEMLDKVAVSNVKINLSKMDSLLNMD